MVAVIPAECFGEPKFSRFGLVQRKLHRIRLHLSKLTMIVGHRRLLFIFLASTSLYSTRSKP